MSFPEYVRVKDKDTGHKYSVIASAVDENAHQVLKQPAVGDDGTPLPPEHAGADTKKTPDTSGSTPGGTTTKES